MKFWIMYVDSYSLLFFKMGISLAFIHFAPALATLINAHIGNIFSKQ